MTLRQDRDKIEEAMVEWWKTGRAVRLTTILKGEKPDGTTHGDHYDYQDHTDAAKAIPCITAEREEVKS